MARRSRIISNWPKYILQWGVLIALIVTLTGLIPSTEAPDPERYCPVGGLQAISTYIVNDSLPCSMSTLQIMMGVVLAAAVILFSKLFCGYICPIGTVEDLLIKLRKALKIKGLKVRNGSFLDKVLRIFKYVILFWIFYMTTEASELFCKNFDPYYAIATGFKGEITLWMAITSVSLLFLGSFVIDMFWCKYLCPLGAISNSLKFWTWIIVLVAFYYVLGRFGLEMPWWILLGGFCLLGYILEIFHRKPKLQVLHIIKDHSACNHCQACTRQCPYHIDVNTMVGNKVNHVDCTLCGECVAACNTGALSVGVGGKVKGKGWKIVPAVLTIGLIAFGIWAGGKMELPTIDMTWGIEQVAEDGTVTQIVDPSTLKTMEITGLRSVKCYGSSMAFKSKLEKIPGIHGVKTFVGKHRALVTYDPSRINEDKIQEQIYVPSKFRVQTPDKATVDSIKVVTIRTEGMTDKLDINYLGLQMRGTEKKIYGLETEFDCPLIVRVYMDPSEEVDEDWFEEIVEMDVLQMPVHGGGVKEIEVDFEFMYMEEGVSYLPVEEYLHKMFSPFKAQFKQRVEEAEGKPQYIYEFAHSHFEKPIFLRNMPYLSNHLSRHDGIIGVYLNLNKDLVPAIQIRYAAPMTEDKLWELITMDTWTITYKADDVREEPAKLTFKEKGTNYPYTE